MDAERRTITITRHEYVLRSPTALGELNKAAAWAMEDLPERRRGWDGSLMVEARDDEIVIWWEERTDG